MPLELFELDKQFMIGAFLIKSYVRKTDQQVKFLFRWEI